MIILVLTLSLLDAAASEKILGKFASAQSEEVAMLQAK